MFLILLSGLVEGETYTFAVALGNDRGLGPRTARTTLQTLLSFAEHYSTRSCADDMTCDAPAPMGQFDFIM